MKNHKRFISCFALYLVFLVCGRSAWATTLPTLSSPSSFQPFQSEFRIQHRFYGPVNEEPLENFLGTTFGANVGLFERICLIPHMELAGSYIYRQREFGLGTRAFTSLRRFPAAGQIELMLFSAEDFFNGPRTWFGFANAGAQEKMGDLLELTQNFFYSQRDEMFGVGLGTAFEILESLDLIAEYAPYLDAAWGNGFTGSYLAGIQLRTYAHTFDLYLSNRSEIGLHRIFVPGDDRAAHFGFSLRRRFGD